MGRNKVSNCWQIRTECLSAQEKKIGTSWSSAGEGFYEMGDERKRNFRQFSVINYRKIIALFKAQRSLFLSCIWSNVAVTASAKVTLCSSAWRWMGPRCIPMMVSIVWLTACSLTAHMYVVAYEEQSCWCSQEVFPTCLLKNPRSEWSCMVFQPTRIVLLVLNGGKQ